jgi:hypothetical protein
MSRRRGRREVSAEVTREALVIVREARDLLGAVGESLSRQAWARTAREAPIHENLDAGQAVYLCAATALAVAAAEQHVRLRVNVPLDVVKVLTASPSSRLAAQAVERTLSAAAGVAGAPAEASDLGGRLQSDVAVRAAVFRIVTFSDRFEPARTALAFAEAAGMLERASKRLGQLAGQNA